MEQFKKLFADLSLMQRATIVAAALVVGAADRTRACVGP